MTPTTYGYLNPDTGDLSKSNTGWMYALNFNWSRLDGHSHNGVDSALLTVGSFSSATVTAPSGSWLVNAGGAGLPSSGYYQLVTAPASIGEINNYSIKFLISTAGSRQYQELQLFYNRLTGSTFNLYCADNTIDILCVFR